eukprot:PhM_4_TR16625/c0_g1_i1/m.9086
MFLPSALSCSDVSTSVRSPSDIDEKSDPNSTPLPSLRTHSKKAAMEFSISPRRADAGDTTMVDARGSTWLPPAVLLRWLGVGVAVGLDGATGLRVREDENWRSGTGATPSSTCCTKPLSATCWTSTASLVATIVCIVRRTCTLSSCEASGRMYHPSSTPATRNVLITVWMRLPCVRMHGSKSFMNITFGFCRDMNIVRMTPFPCSVCSTVSEASSRASPGLRGGRLMSKDVTTMSLNKREAPRIDAASTVERMRAVSMVLLCWGRCAARSRRSSFTEMISTELRMFDTVRLCVRSAEYNVVAKDLSMSSSTGSAAAASGR